MMKRVIAALCVAAMAAVPAVPATAQTIQFGSGMSSGQQDLRGDRNWDRGDRNWDRGDRDRRGGQFERRGQFSYYNGFRGYPDRRPGYRQFNGFWFPSSAFSVQIYVDGDRNRGNSVRLSERHIEWCEDHYRSYRLSDNTFKPYSGPRRQCVSPFLG